MTREGSPIGGLARNLRVYVAGHRRMVGSAVWRFGLDALGAIAPRPLWVVAPKSSISTRVGRVRHGCAVVWWHVRRVGVVHEQYRRVGARGVGRRSSRSTFRIGDAVNLRSN